MPRRSVSGAIDSRLPWPSAVLTLLSSQACPSKYVPWSLTSFVSPAAALSGPVATGMSASKRALSWPSVALSDACRLLVCNTQAIWHGHCHVTVKEKRWHGDDRDEGKKLSKYQSLAPHLSAASVAAAVSASSMILLRRHRLNAYICRTMRMTYGKGDKVAFSATRMHGPYPSATMAFASTALRSCKCSAPLKSHRRPHVYHHCQCLA